MSAIVPGTHSEHNDSSGQITANAVTDHSEDKQKLQQDLLAAAKQCHVRFGGKAELATESDSCVNQLCYAFEKIFSHGLKANKTSEKSGSALRQVSELVKSAAAAASTGSSNRVPEVGPFWPFVRDQLTWHEQERFQVLRKVYSDQGRGRAWLRAALNERSLERHLHALVAPVQALEAHYHDWAFLRDQDRSALLPNVAAGLTTILFAIRIDNEELNDSSEENRFSRCKNTHSEPIINSELPEPSPSSRKARKKVQTHIISFDDDEPTSVGTSSMKVPVNFSSAPPTCPNSLSPESAVRDVSPAPSTSPASASPRPLSATDDVVLDVQPIGWSESRETCEDERLLTPLTDNENMGGLVPVSPLDNALDDMMVSLTSYLEDDEPAEAAVEATEPLDSVTSDADTLDAEGLRLRLVTLNETLEQAREDAITSKLQLARFQRQHQNYLEKHELQIQTLNRENELLRQQLRKYVTAVQMLKKDSDLNNHSGEESPDYHRESEQYQSKLVQVAEMHAELMEFNARLTMQLTNKDRLVKLLRAELECLRGPINEEDLPSEAPCFIHIWIPSAFLTGQPSDIHHVYQIYVRIRDTEWNIYRRYAQFYSLFKELKKHDSIVASFEFPPKKTIGNKDAKFVDERRQKLQQWLRQIVNRLSHCSPVFSSRPCKQTLISLMPFFGDFPSNEGNSRNNPSRNAFSASPQYMGL
ncbi:hypothetical protein QAD02_016978 [Eretmocerus hayati]|uniref:Uncharacterized protein n=1 Tax=Eretmocerus hayati TaxID=131215 RepID=A0ACC2PEF2_9HYME|nr:hypothetical protein QAD02_016978 [Eretmocerus hayati]